MDAKLSTRAYRRSLPLVLPEAFYEYTHKLLTRQPTPWFGCYVEYGRDFPENFALDTPLKRRHYKNYAFHHARDLHFSREYGTSYRKR